MEKEKEKEQNAALILLCGRNPSQPGGIAEEIADMQRLPNAASSAGKILPQRHKPKRNEKSKAKAYPVQCTF